MRFPSYFPARNVGEANSYVDCCMNHLSNISFMCVSSSFSTANGVFRIRCIIYLICAALLVSIVFDVTVKQFNIQSILRYPTYVTDTDHQRRPSNDRLVSSEKPEENRQSTSLCERILSTIVNTYSS